jgi:hypothetical protein
VRRLSPAAGARYDHHASTAATSSERIQASMCET